MSGIRKSDGHGSSWEIPRFLQFRPRQYKGLRKWVPKSVLAWALEEPPSKPKFIPRFQCVCGDKKRDHYGFGANKYIGLKGCTVPECPCPGFKH